MGGLGFKYIPVTSDAWLLEYQTELKPDDSNVNFVESPLAEHGGVSIAGIPRSDWMPDDIHMSQCSVLQLNMVRPQLLGSRDNYGRRYCGGFKKQLGRAPPDYV